MANLLDEYCSKASKYAFNTTLEDVNYAIYISLKNKYVYVETAKVACSTIKLTLQRLEIEDKTFSRERFDDVHNRVYSPLLRPQQVPNFETMLTEDDYFRFCFVRNPYTRILSAYLDKIKGNSRKEKSFILSQLGLNQRNLNVDISFERFISALEEQPISVMNNHWRHQYYSTFQRNIQYHFVGRFEEFSKDFSYVMHRLGATDFYKTESRHATNSSSSFLKYYNDDLMERVYRLYKIDFDTFSYSKEAPV